ncbi:MAG: DUF2974 domain-containing protein [Bacilli bacterium]|nr:DUF2974 domain-containing protein [Bacilli bacterium]
MYTIIDYIKYYKNFTIKDINWNMMDNLIVAIISYFPLKDFKEKKLSEACQDVLDLNIVTKSPMMNGVLDVTKEIINAKRYQNAKIINFINRRDKNTQFGALTFTLDNIKTISFKGTDSSTIGWLEDFRLWYEYPTYTQKLAIEYVRDNINILDNNIYLVGHSKGGNLAEIAGMELSPLLLPKIKKIISFDGPGLRPKEFESIKYKNIQRKLNVIVPSGSYVGTLMLNKNPIAIKTNTMGINVHYPTNWLVFGEHFVTSSLSTISKEFHASSVNSFKEIKDEELKDVIETLFKTLNKDNDADLKINFNELGTIYQNMKNIDPKIRNYINKIFGALTSGFGKKGDEHGQKN